MTTSTRKNVKSILPDVPLDPIIRLSKDLANSSISLSINEARFLVDAYYTIQEHRIATEGQVRALANNDDPSAAHGVIKWLVLQLKGLEHQIHRALDNWSDSQPLGVWAKSITGIGPVIASGLLAHIDITKAPTVGHIWVYAGIENSVKWYGSNAAKELIEGAYTAENGDHCRAIFWLSKALHRHPSDLMQAAGIKKINWDQAREAFTGFDTERVWRFENVFEKYPLHIDNAIHHICEEAELDEGMIFEFLYRGANPDLNALKKFISKRPWNATLKTLQWKIGESFVSQQNHENDYYGKIYRQRKDLEITRNAENKFSDQASEILRNKKFGKETQARTFYERGQLPPAHIHARAKRYAVKLFLSHYHEVAYRQHYKSAPPKPFTIEHLGHAHYIPVPNSHLI